MSICSSGPDNQFSTPTTTPTLQPTSSSSSPSQDTVVTSTQLHPSPPLPPPENLPDVTDTDLPLPPPSDKLLFPSESVDLVESEDSVFPAPGVEPLISLEDEELPPYSEHDLTFVSPLPNRDQLHNSFSTEALEISHTPIHDQPKKVLSDSEVSMISVHTPVSNHGDQTTQLPSSEEWSANQPHAPRADEQVAQQPRRAGLCTPIHSASLSASDSQLHKYVFKISSQMGSKICSESLS